MTRRSKPGSNLKKAPAIAEDCGTADKMKAAAFSELESMVCDLARSAKLAELAIEQIGAMDDDTELAIDAADRLIKEVKQLHEVWYQRHGAAADAGFAEACHG